MSILSLTSILYLLTGALLNVMMKDFHSCGTLRYIKSVFGLIQQRTFTYTAAYLSFFIIFLISHSQHENILSEITDLTLCVCVFCPLVLVGRSHRDWSLQPQSGPKCLSGG